MAFVQSVSNNDFGNGSVAATLPGNTVAGNLLIAFVAWDNQTATVAVSGSVAGAFTAIDNPHDHTGGDLTRSATFYKANIAGGAETVTATFTGTAPVAQLIVHEVSGLDTVAPLDQHKIVSQTSVGTGANAVTTGNVTTTTDGQYIFGATYSSNGQGGPVTQGTGFTIHENASNERSSEDQIQAAAGAIAVRFTDGAAFGNHDTAIVTFKAASGATDTPRTPTAGSVGLTGNAPSRVIGTVVTPATP